MSNIKMLVDEIIDGEYDDDFDAIYNAIKVRKKATLAGKTLSFRLRDRVRFNNHARPKYLVGVEGVVTKINDSTVVVQIGEDGGRYANTAPRCPVAIVDKIED